MYTQYTTHTDLTITHYSGAFINLHEFKKPRTKKQLAREHAKHIAMLRRTCRPASRQLEEALLTAAPELRFYGQIIIEPREEAIATS